MKKLKKKTILALAAMLLLASAGTFLLIREGVRLVEEREETRNIRKLEAADNLYQLIVERVGSVYDALENHGRKNVEIMTVGLGKYLKDGEYTGPVCFEDGFVFRVKDGDPVFPDTVPEGFAGFDADASLLSRMDGMLQGALSECTVTFTGRAPSGLSIEDVKRFLKNLRARGARLVIDSKSFSLDDLIECRPWLIKPNEEEIAEYLGREVNSFAEIADAALNLQRGGIENVMISLGAKGAMLACGAGVLVATPPQIEVRSTIGAGDSSIAGFLAATAIGADASACLCEAVAYGSAACMSEGTQPPSTEDVDKIRDRIRCERLTCDE